VKSRKVRVGLVGCGELSRRVHLVNLARQGGQIVALVDPDPENLRTISALAPAASCFSDVGPLLEQQGVEAVVIASPTRLHLNFAETALAAGKHVYVEKPVIFEPPTRPVVVSPLICAVGFNLRFHPLLRDLRAKIQSGRVGRVLTLRTVFTQAGTPGRAWRRERKTCGGALLDLGSHHLDLIRFLTGSEVTQVTAVLESRYSEHDTVWVDFTLLDGSRVQGFFAYASADDELVEVYGEAGRLAVRRYSSLEVDEQSAHGAHERQRQLGKFLRLPLRLPYLFRKFRSTLHEPSHELAMKNFLDSIRGSIEAEGADLVDARHNSRLLLACERSAHERRTVLMDEVD
jgi:myo-inositol 2-dehydrogenase/D-chiro-inositol 1-dehydrogenase